MGMCKPSGGIFKVVGHVGTLDRFGTPNSRYDLYNENGELLQQRWYGPNGNAYWDRDWKHGGNHEFPHDHKWEWDNWKHPGRPAYKGPSGELTNPNFE